MGVAYVNVRVSRYLKEELAWTIDKRLQVISNIMLFKTVTHYYVSPLVTHSH